MHRGPKKGVNQEYDIYFGQTFTIKIRDFFFGSKLLQGHPPELSDSVKLLLTDAKRHGFEINHVLKSID